ncbi:MAG: hypothetical protein ABJ000_02785 [Saccharospirillum sp.]|uniref:hypothetical protein n=1 Tax=Saccharospirillum sp. TaxID=2033801 RepID=UPI0032968C0D
MDTESEQSFDTQHLLTENGLTPDFSLDDRSEPASLPSLLLLARLPLTTSDSIPTGSKQRRTGCHFKAWPQAPPAT